MKASQPLFVYLKETIIAAIGRGEWLPGDQLPSQRELCRQYHMSHMTVRRAINELINEGAIQAIPGKGLYVAEKTRAADSSSLLGFEQQMTRLGLSPATRVLAAELVSASTVLARVLGVKTGVPLVYLHRLRLANGEPQSLTSVYLPHALCPGLLEQGLENDSLFATLRHRYHLNLTSSMSTIEAVLADEAQAQLLQLTMPAPLLVREQTTYLDTGQAIEFSRSFMRGDRYHIQVAEGNPPVSEPAFTGTMLKKT